MKKTEILYALSLVISLAGHNAWVFFGLPTYYIGEAIGNLLLHIVIALFAPKPLHWIFVVGLFLSANRLMDELFGNPTEFNIFEYVNAGIMICFFIARYIIRNKNHY